MKKIAVIIFLLLFSFSVRAQECGDVNSSLDLTHDVNSTGTCFNVIANDIVIDCHGFEINYSQSTEGYGIYVNGFNTTTVKNCMMNGFTPNSPGILLAYSYNNTISNITIQIENAESCGVFLNNSYQNNITDININTKYADSYGLRLISASDNIFKNFNITTEGASTYGIYFSSSLGNEIYDSAVKTLGDYSYAVYFYSNSNENLLSGSDITTIGSVSDGIRAVISDNNTFLWTNVTTSGSTSTGIYFYISDNTTVESVKINTTSGYGIHFLSNSKNNMIKNSFIYGSNNSFSSEQCENTFLNATFSKDSLHVFNSSKLYIKWYLDVYVKNALNGSISDANVTVKDNKNQTIFSELTNILGRISTKEVIEYIVNDTGTDYFSNHTANATKFESSKSQEFSMNESKLIELTLGMSICKQLDTNYTLINEVSAAGTCFEIMANNVKIDCNNFSIYYATENPGYGVITNGYNNTRIENCIFIQNSSAVSNAYAVFLNKSSYDYVLNNKIYANNSGGIYLVNSSFNILTGYTEINHSYYGVYLNNSHNNNISFVFNDSYRKLGLYSSSGNIIKNSIFYVDNQTFSWNSDNTFLNNSFDPAKISLTNSNLTVKWYVDFFVNDTDGNNVDGANITLWDKDNSKISSDLTINGHLLKILKEYWQNDSAKIFYTNYTANYTKTGYFSSSKGFNFTESTTIEKTIKESVVPTIIVDSPMNGTYPRNVQVKYRVSDNAKIDRCWWTNVTGESNELTNCQNTTMILEEGQYNITIYANDTNGNVNFSQVFFYIDASISILFAPETPNNETVALPYVIINVSIGDFPDSIFLEWNSINESMEGSSLVRQKTKNHLLNGNYTFRVWANDSYGNMNSTEIRWVYVNYSDNVTPEFSIYSPISTTYSTSTIPLTYTVSDDVIIDKCWYSLNSETNITLSGCQNTTITAILGSNTLTLVANDSSGNIKEEAIIFTYSTAVQPPGDTTGGPSGYFGPGKGNETIKPELKPALCQLDIRGEAPETVEAGKEYMIKVFLWINNTCRDVVLIAGEKTIEITSLENETRMFYFNLKASLQKDNFILKMNATNLISSSEKTYIIKIYYRTMKLSIDDSLLSNGTVFIKAEKYHRESYLEIIVTKDKKEILKKYTQLDEYSFWMNVSWGSYEIIARERFDGNIIDEEKYEFNVPLEMRPYFVLIADAAIIVIAIILSYIFILNIGNIADRGKYGFFKMKIRKIRFESTLIGTRKNTNEFIRNTRGGFISAGKAFSDLFHSSGFRMKRIRKKFRLFRYKFSLGNIDKKFKKGHISFDEYIFLKQLERRKKGFE